MQRIDGWRAPDGRPRASATIGLRRLGRLQYERYGETMHLWMYLVVIGMIVGSLIATVWVTLWTIQRGEKLRAAAVERTRIVTRPAQPAHTDAEPAPSLSHPASAQSTDAPATDAV